MNGTKRSAPTILNEANLWETWPNPD